MAILGTAPSSLNLAPVAPDSGWEIWTCSLLPMPHMGLPRWTRHFELHRPEEIGAWRNLPPEERERQRQNYLRWMREQPAEKPIITQGKWPDVPASVPYPLEEIMQAFPRRYFTSTIAYMIALALFEGVKKIGMWGVDMSLYGERYTHQRACLEWLCGICDGAGVQMVIPDTCDLMKAATLYAFGHESALVKRLAARKAHIEQQRAGVQQQIAQMEQQIHKAREALAGYAGVADDLDWVAGNWTNGFDQLEYINGDALP